MYIQGSPKLLCKNILYVVLTLSLGIMLFDLIVSDYNKCWLLCTCGTKECLHICVTNNIVCCCLAYEKKIDTTTRMILSTTL